MNISDFTMLYRSRILSVGNSDALVRISLPVVKPKHIRVLTHVTVENITSAYSKLRLGIRNTGIIYYLNEQKPVLAAELISAPHDYILGEGDSFFSELTGTTTSDKLIFCAWGWEYIK